MRYVQYYLKNTLERANINSTYTGPEKGVTQVQ